MLRTFFVVLVLIFSTTAFAEDYLYAERTHASGSSPRDWVEGAKSIGQNLLWAGGYHEGDYHSLAVGVGREWGGLSAAVFIGRESDAGEKSDLVGAWAFHRSDRDEAYFYAEKSRTAGNYHRAFVRYYPGDRLFFGVAKESDLSFGPTVGVKFDKMKFWAYVPAKAANDGRKLVVGASIEF